MFHRRIFFATIVYFQSESVKPRSTFNETTFILVHAKACIRACTHVFDRLDSTRNEKQQVTCLIGSSARHFVLRTLEFYKVG